MTSRRFLAGQFLEDPLLDVLADRQVAYFADASARDAWVQARLEVGRPVPAGKPVLLLDTYTIQHRASDGSWVSKFPRSVVDPEVEPQTVGVFPPRKGDWSNPPLAARLEGLPPGGDLPLTVPSGVRPVSHSNHTMWTLIGSRTLTVLNDVDAQLIAVGAGGYGQNWRTTPWRVRLTDTADEYYYGGAGGGAGGVVAILVRLRAGQTLTTATGVCGTPEGSTTSVSIDGRVVVAAPGGEPQVSAGTWTNWLRGDRVYGSTGGRPARRKLGGSGWRTTVTELGPNADRPRPAGLSLLGLRMLASYGAANRTDRRIPTGQVPNVNLGWAYLAGAGGGAKGPAPAAQIDLTNRRERAVGSTRAANPGGPGVWLTGWQATALGLALGGPAGSIWGAGNSHLDSAGALALNPPTEWGSGGQGGGTDGNQPNAGTLTGASAGQPGVVLLRHPNRGLPLVWTDL